MVVNSGNCMVLGFHSSQRQAELLANQLAVPCAKINVHSFPDGESRVTIPTNLPDTVLFMQSLDNPNAKLIELILALEASRRHGCRNAVLIAPYLSYMRQDIEFEPGQAVSQLIIGDLLSSRLEAVITIDPHLHRINHLSDSFTKCVAVSLSAAATIGQHLKTGPENRILVGPDEESEQWVKTAAEVSGLPYCIASKVRHGDRNVEVSLPEGDFQEKHAILVDDVISSGHTIKQAAIKLLHAGCRQVDAACTHALFASGAMTELRNAGVTNIISSNSIPHDTNSIDLTTLIAEAVEQLAK